MMSPSSIGLPIRTGVRMAAAAAGSIPSAIPDVPANAAAAAKPRKSLRSI